VGSANRSRVLKIGDFRHTLHYVSETVQARDIVSTEV